MLQFADTTTCACRSNGRVLCRGVGIDHATCGVTTQTTYTDEHVRPLAAGYETDGSIFLLWERKANYSDASNDPHLEDICGCTYVKVGPDNKAIVIATFRQPSREELREHYAAKHGLAVRPGADNFFEGSTVPDLTPVQEAAMLSAARTLYGSYEAGKGHTEAVLADVASSKLRVREPMWEVVGDYLPVNRVEASMWIERSVKNAKGKLKVTPKALAPAEGANMVFVLWFAEGLDEVEVAGVHVLFFEKDLKIKSLVSFREPTAEERKFHLRPQNGNGAQ